MREKNHSIFREYRNPVFTKPSRSRGVEVASIFVTFNGSSNFATLDPVGNFSSNNILIITLWSVFTKVPLKIKKIMWFVRSGVILTKDNLTNQM